MDTYLYLALTLILLTIWIVIALMRPDLRRKMWRASIMGGIAGMLAELWYFTDYWRPPTLLGIAALSPEDILIGFALAGVGMTIYDVLLRTTDVPGKNPRRIQFLFLFLAGFASLLIFSTWLGYNSCVVSEMVFAGAALIMVSIRYDLLRVSLISGLAMGLLGFAIYLVLFTWLAPHYWHTYWLLKDTTLGVMILDIPLTEIGWFISWGFLAGIAHNFAAGKIKKSILA